MSDSIITLDVGGQMFKTQISTLTKYPDSMLAIMFQHTVNGLAPMPMTKDGAYFLDANPLYFGGILDYLRHGKIVAEDPNVLKGIKTLANYFRLEELIKELSLESKPHAKDGWVTLDLQGKKEIKVLLADLTRFSTSLLARYFIGDDQSESLLSQSKWIKKESETRYYIGRPYSTSEHMFNFLQAYPRSYVPNVPVEDTKRCRQFLKQELNMFGLGQFYTVTKCLYHLYPHPVTTHKDLKQLCQFNWI